MKIGAAITWEACRLDLLAWLHLHEDADQNLRTLFELAREAAVEYLEDRDFRRVSPMPTWVPGVGEVVPDASLVTITDLPVPWAVKVGVYEYVRAARTLLARAGGDGLGLASGSAAGVSETYTTAAANSVHLGALAAAIPFWSRWKLPSRQGVAG